VPTRTEYRNGGQSYFTPRDVITTEVGAGLDFFPYTCLDIIEANDVIVNLPLKTTAAV
jgi:hypothetical protein